MTRRESISGPGAGYFELGDLNMYGNEPRAESGVMTPNRGRVVRNVRRLSSEKLDRLRELPPAYVSDALGRHLCLDHAIKPLGISASICGPAITCLGPDIAVRKMAIDLAQPGDILVIGTILDIPLASFGHGTALRASARGIAGVVIDGYTRDSAALRGVALPVFARGCTARNYAYPFARPDGGVNVPIVCGGVLVSPGDVVLGDSDGVAVIPLDIAEQQADSLISEYLKVEQRHFAEANLPYGVEAELREAGFRFE
jgi:4-hydroxy-4-methyl-2-oxoglutarate aldolase